MTKIFGHQHPTVNNITVAAVNESNDIVEIATALQIGMPVDSSSYNWRYKFDFIVVVFGFAILPFFRREIEWKVCQKTNNLTVI